MHRHAKPTKQKRWFFDDRRWKKNYGEKREKKNKCVHIIMNRQQNIVGALHVIMHCGRVHA